MAHSTSGPRSRHIVLVLALIALLAGALPAATSAAPPDASARAAGTGAPDSDLRFIVTYEGRPGKAAEGKIKALGGKVRQHLDLIDGLAVELPRGQAKKLKADPTVTGLELDNPLTLFDHSANTGDLEYENAWGVEHIGSRRVHLTGNTAQGIKVAVIDTGLDYIHDDPDDQPYVVDPEFTWHYRGGYDFYNNDADPMDDNGHGTHVAGSLAANHNGYLVVGVAPDADLYALKVLSANGEGDYSGLIAALGWAVDHDIDVVNMSLGGHDASAALQAAIAAAYDAGVTLVAASGNVNPNSLTELLYGCPVAYPAAYDQVIAVSFTNQQDKLTGFSCTGTQVDFAAPGDQIFSPVPIGSCMFCSPNGYAALSGTSMASPHVAGVAALVLSAGIADGNGNGLVADDIKAHLCANTSPANMSPSDARYPKWYGCGIVDADKALVDFPPPGATPGIVAAGDVAVTPEDTAVDVPVLANDTGPAGATLALAAVSDPDHGTTTANPDGTVHYLPDADFNGSDTFTYVVGDGTGTTATGSVNVTVSPVNDPPIAAPDSLVTSAGTAGTVDVLANDIDVDGDSLSVTAVGAPASGTVVLGVEGSVTYTPATGFSGDDAFSYDLSDGVTTVTGTVSVSVVSTNTPPVAVDDSATTDEDTAVTIDLAANDTDAEGGTLSVTGVDQPSHGTTSIDGSGRVVYTPAADYHGPDSFEYTVADQIGATDIGRVDVTVLPANDPPIATADEATTPEDTAVSIDVLGNDSDPDGDPLAVTGVGMPSLGSVVVEAGGTVLYTPPADYAGSDSFQYTVGDGAGGSATATVSVNVTAANDVPVAYPKSVTTAYQTAVSVTMSGSDVETCDLTFQVVTPPVHGSVGTPSNVLCVTLLPPYSDSSKITYTPAAGYSGPDSFTYRVSDGTAWSAPATVSLTVTSPSLLHIGDLDAIRTLSTSTWTAKVTLYAHNASHATVSGVTVTATWGGGVTGTISCKTGSKGTCLVQKTSIPKSVTSVTFTVTGMSTKTGVYSQTANHDPDTDSDGTTITVQQ